MAFYGYPDYVGEHSSTSYHQFYPTQSSLSYSPHEFYNPNLIENIPNYNNNYHDYSGYYAKHPEVNYNYSVYNSSEPKLIQYNSDYGFSETKYIVSYSTLERQDTDFDEYDSDPYDGGYDIQETYGKPLPPSDKTCYPPSTKNTPDLESFSYGSIPSPYGKEPKENHQPVKPSKETEQGIPKNRDIVTSDAGKLEDKLEDPNKGINVNSSNNDEKKDDDDYGYGYNYQVANVPYGSGLESVDICESIFGYWPCWEKFQKGNVNCQVSDQESSRNTWESTADYLFGSPFGYGGDNHERSGDFSYGSYYQQQNQYLNGW